MAAISRQLRRDLIKAHSPVVSARLRSCQDVVETAVGVIRGRTNIVEKQARDLKVSRSQLDSQEPTASRVISRALATGKCVKDAPKGIQGLIKDGIFSSRQTFSRRCNSFITPSDSYLSRESVRLMSAVVSADDKHVHEELDMQANVEENDSKNGNTVGDERESEVELEVDPVYTAAEGPAHLTLADVNKYLTVSPQHVNEYFGEGLPPSLMKEFEESKQVSFLIRGRVLELFDRFRRALCDTQSTEPGGRERSLGSKHRPQCLLEGFIKSGKSASLAMLVYWARMQGWLVFYVPNGRDWTSGGMYYKNEQTGLWDTPVQAKIALEGFLKSQGTLLASIPCRVLKPIQLGEGAGVGRMRGIQEVSFPNGATLKDLVEKGIAVSQASVSVVVRLREELSLVKEAPVLICIDEFNSWFTFSHYHEATGTRSRRPIHAREVSMVNAFRIMEGPLMMACAFSQSLAVGKLPVHLPGIPKNVRFTIQRYNLEEATAAMNYYHSRKMTFKQPSEEDIRKLFYLTNGNGEEIRTLSRLLG